MDLFWWNGYRGTSMGDLVAATGVSRQGIYGDFDGKRALFLACLDHYRDSVVTPAFAVVEQRDATVESIEDYFATQIRRAKQAGLPGPGCLFANTMTELGAADEEIADRVCRHNERLKKGFQKILERSVHSDRDPAHLAAVMVIFTQGLWSASRVVATPRTLTHDVKAFLSALNLA